MLATEGRQASKGTAVDGIDLCFRGKVANIGAVTGEMENQMAGLMKSYNIYACNVMTFQFTSYVSAFVAAPAGSCFASSR
jgi:hypothetical protein